MVTNQVSPLGTQDFSQYLTNIANSGAEFIVNVNWGRDAVLSIQQAKQFGLTPKMKMVIPYQIPFLAKEVGRSSPKALLPPLISGGRWKTSIRWPKCSSRLSTRNTATSRNGVPTTPICNSPSGRGWSRSRHLLSAEGHQDLREGRDLRLHGRRSAFPPEDHQLVRPVVIVRGKSPKEMKNKEDYWEVIEVVPGEPLMQQPDAFGCNLGDYT